MLKSVDQYLNIKLDDISVVDDLQYPHLVRFFLSIPRTVLCPGSRATDGRVTTPRPDPQSAVKNVFIRGSVVRYVHLPAQAVDVPLLEDATRRGTSPLPRRRRRSRRLMAHEHRGCERDGQGKVKRSRGGVSEGCWTGWYGG